MFTYSHKTNDDFVFTSDKGRLVINTKNNNVCFIGGKEFVYYHPKRKDGMLELMVQYSMLEPDFNTVPDPFSFIMLKGSPNNIFKIID